MPEVILPKPVVFFWFVFSTTIGMNAQQDIDHWEAVVMDGTSWRYLVPTGQPNAEWNTPEFNDDSWLEGPSGFGYGDGDDATIVSPTPSLYLRHTFQVENLDSWLDVDFFMDYDDGFVAYLNGTEIARGNTGITGAFIAWNQNLATDHEAVLYAGGIPPMFDFDFVGLLVEGENTLSIELHNVNPTSSDLTARPFLMVGTTTSGLGLETPPAWFNPMTSDVHDVTFNLNMTNETVSPTGVFVAGGSFFGVAGDHPMTDSDGDGTWTVTIPVPNGFTGYYTFLNGNCLDWSCKENIAGLECAHPENYNDRMLDNIQTDTSVSTCFGQCTKMTPGLWRTWPSSTMLLASIKLAMPRTITMVLFPSKSADLHRKCFRRRVMPLKPKTPRVRTTTFLCLECRKKMTGFFMDHTRTKQ